MPATHLRADAAVNLRVLFGALFWVIGLVFITAQDHGAPGPFWRFAFCDARVFGRAALAIAAGRNPYERLQDYIDLNHMPFVQPPHVVWLLEPFARTPGSLALLDGMMIALILTGIAAAVRSSARLFLGASPSRLFLASGIFIGMIASSGMMTLLTSNIGALFTGAIFAAMVRGVRLERWLWFHVAVLVATTFKPFYAAFWLIPVLAKGWSWRQVWAGGLALSLAAAIGVSGVLLEPELTRSWLDNLESRQRVGDVGCCIYSVGRALSLGDRLPLALHAIYAAGLLALLVFGRARGRMRHAALVLVALALNPRMNAYDFAFAAIPAYFILSSQFAGWRRLGVVAPLLALALAIGSSIVKLHSRNGTNLIVLAVISLAILVATCWPTKMTEPRFRSS